VRKSKSGEIKGFSFKLKDCANAIPIKARDVSANFDKELFRAVQALHATHDINTMNRVANYAGLMSKAEPSDLNVSHIPTVPQAPAEFSEVSISGGDLQNDDALLSKKKKKKNNIDSERWMDL
jgi:hypothetical protein